MKNLDSFNELDASMTQEILQYAISNGNIDVAHIQEQIYMKSKIEVLKKHPYVIWKGKDEYWYTYLPDSEKGRVKKKKNSREKIEEIIVEYYAKVENEPTFDTVFNTWIEQKLEFREISNESYDRYKTDYDRFFANKAICNMKIKDITEEYLEGFIRKTVVDLNLTQKAYAGMRILINGIFRQGRKYCKFSITNFFGDFKLPTRSFKKNPKLKENEVFTEDETLIITDYIKKNPTLRRLGILLAFQTGARVGELAALRREDIGNRSIHVQRTEVKYKDENGRTKREVRDFPKTDAGNRYIITNESAMDTIQKIYELNPNGEYLFQNGNRRILSNYFGKELKAICEKLNLNPRSMHKIRKTYATTLLDSDVDDSIVAEMMGHADITTTRKIYYLSNKSNESKREQIQRAKLM